VVAQPARGAVVPLMMEHAPATDDVKRRLLADLVQSMSAGHLLQATAVAVLVGRNAYDVVQQALAGSDGKGPPVDERLQLHLRNVVTVLSVALRHFGDVGLAVQWYRTDRLPNGAHDTPEALTVAGRLEDVYRHLLRTQAGSGRKTA
jgi:hypothetical protein